MSDERIPIEHVLSGMALHRIDEGWSPLEAFVLIKCLNEEGDSTWSFRTTNRLNRQELLGALTVQVELLKNELVQEWDLYDE